MKSHTIPALMLTIGFLLAAGDAYGRAPTLEDLPTVKKIQEDAEKAIEDRRRAEIEAQKDPVLDAIHAYRDKAVPMFAPHWKKIAEILKDDRASMDHRKAASEAFCTRFLGLTGTDARVEKLKKDIGRDLLPKLNDNNTEIRVIVANVFGTFWPGTAGNIRFNPEDTNFKKRYDAYKAWRKFLKGR